MTLTKTPPAEILLVVVNPAKNNSIALDRAIITARLRQPKPTLHVLFAVDDESAGFSENNKKLFRDQIWLQSVIQRIEDEEIEYSYEFCWSRNWYDSVLSCSDRCNPDLILIPDHSFGKKNNYFTNANWALLRKSLSPVMIVRPDASNHRKKVLAAVNIQNESAEYVELNNKILTKGMAIAELYKAEFFVVNSYKGSIHYPNREKIISMTGLPSKQVHAEEGEPAEVISHYADRIEADIVILGTKAKSGALSLMRGNTSARVLKKLSQDVITFS